MSEKRTKATRWTLSDALWEKIESLLPVPENTHPRGGGKKRVPYRKVMNGILFVLRTGCQWKALDATGICSASTAHARFQEWEEATQLDESLPSGSDPLGEEDGKLCWAAPFCLRLHYFSVYWH